VGLVWSYDPESYAGGSVRMLLVEPPLPNRSRVMTQKKWDTLAFQAGGWAWGLQPHPVIENIVTKPQGNEAGWIPRQRHEAIHKGLWLRTGEQLRVKHWHLERSYGRSVKDAYKSV